MAIIRQKRSGLDKMVKMCYTIINKLGTKPIVSKRRKVAFPNRSFI